MLDDVAAIQDKYRADMSTRNSATTYGFHSTADKDVFDFSHNSNPILTIWDGGGVDTLDCSGFVRFELARGELGPSLTAVYPNQHIDLHAGSFSDVGWLEDNVAIAFNCTIENAIGGGGNDTITGNNSANRLQGGSGDDRLSGEAGNDVLIGGDGRDMLIGGAGADDLTGGSGNDTFQFLSIFDSRPAGPFATTRSWDVIRDFQHGDTIDLSAIDANSSNAGRQGFEVVPELTGHAGELEFHRAGAEWVVSADVNGGGVDFMLKVTLAPGTPSLTESDFTLFRLPTYTPDPIFTPDHMFML